MANEKTISLESLTLLNFMVNKHLIAAVIGAEKLSKEQTQAVLDAAKRELLRTTLSVGPNEVDEMLTMLWADYVPPLIDPKRN
jgi:hypothetical protein